MPTAREMLSQADPARSVDDETAGDLLAIAGAPDNAGQG